MRKNPKQPLDAPQLRSKAVYRKPSPPIGGNQALGFRPTWAAGSSHAGCFNGARLIQFGVQALVAKVKRFQLQSQSLSGEM